MVAAGTRSANVKLKSADGSVVVKALSNTAFGGCSVEFEVSMMVVSLDSEVTPAESAAGTQIRS